MRLTFLGAAQTVTGSKFRLQVDGKDFLVDAGLFQGRKDLRERNWLPMPFPVQNIDAILLTHAHIDHSGLIPRLVADGFRGSVYCSDATADLCRILWPDSGRIQEDDAQAANRYGYSQHQPALPLYTEAEALTALEHLKVVPYGLPQSLTDEFRFTLSRAGHILGASFIQATGDDGTSILFSGDIGRPNSPIMRAPAKMQDADYLVLESTYGDRLHGGEDPAEQIGEVIRRTAARGGTIIVPAFAVGRAQDFLYYLYTLKRDHRIPDLPVYLDSPMAINATELLVRHKNQHRLTPQDCAAMCSNVRYARTAQDSRAINESPMPKIIVSASGMATGGRVLHHLKQYLGDPRHTILLAGFQAAGTRGDRLARGETILKIHGKDWQVRAEIAKLDTMSAHADYREILNWLRNFRAPPRRVFITHGEPEAARAMQQHIEITFGWDVMVPELGDTIEL